MTPTFGRRNEARTERIQQTLAAGLLSEHYPEVSKIVITMVYTKGGATSLLRTLNFYPGSHAFFKMNCLGEGCVDGGLDLTGVITRMIRNRKESSGGKISCENDDPAAVHAAMSYEVTIQYS